MIRLSNFFFIFVASTFLAGCATIPGAILVGGVAAGAIGYTIVQEETPVDALVSYMKNMDCNAIRKGKDQGDYCRIIGSLSKEQLTKLAVDEMKAKESEYWCYDSLGGQECYSFQDKSREEIPLRAVNEVPARSTAFFKVKEGFDEGLAAIQSKQKAINYPDPVFEGEAPIYVSQEQKDLARQQEQAILAQEREQERIAQEKAEKEAEEKAKAAQEAEQQQNAQGQQQNAQGQQQQRNVRAPVLTYSSEGRTGGQYNAQPSWNYQQEATEETNSNNNQQFPTPLWSDAN